MTAAERPSRAYNADLKKLKTELRAYQTFPERGKLTGALDFSSPVCRCMSDTASKSGKFWPVFLAVVTIFLGQYYFDTQQKQRFADQEQQRIKREEEREVQLEEHQDRERRKVVDEVVKKAMQGPSLRYLSGRPDADNTYIYNFANESASYDAVVTLIMFVVTDPKELAKLEQTHSRPAPGQKPCPIYGDEGYFVQGCWIGDEYHFASSLEKSVPKGGHAQIRLRVANDFYGTRWIRGELRLFYNGKDSPFRLPDASVLASPKFLE